MPSSTPDAYYQWLAEPSIVVEPGLAIEEPPPEQSDEAAPAQAAPLAPYDQARRSASKKTLRAVASAGLLGITLFSVAQADRWLSLGHRSAHAAEAPTVGHPSLPPPTFASVVAPTPKREPMPVAVPSAAGIGGPEQPLQLDDDPAEASPDAQYVRQSLSMARRLLARRHYDHAEVAFNDVLALRPGHPGAFSGLARVWLGRGDLDAALKFARLAVKAGPSHAIYHVTLGDVRSARFETGAADKEYRMAARLGQPVEPASRRLPRNPF